MTRIDEHRDADDALDRALGSLPREVPPSAALWSKIAAEISVVPVQRATQDERARGLPGAGRAQGRVRRLAVNRRWLSLAAGVLLIVASSMTTWMVTQRSMRDAIAQARQSSGQSAVQQMQPVLTAMPASFGVQATLGSDYGRARAQLVTEFDRRMALLLPVTRAKVMRDLAELRHAANEIAVALGQHPTDPLLQQLLLSAYQDELTLLGSVSELSSPATAGAEL